MSVLIKEYNVPFLGKVKLIQATGYAESPDGNYYAQINGRDTLFCQKCKSLGELMEQVDNKIKNHFKNKIENTKRTISNAKEKRIKLELMLGKTDLGDETVKNSYDWLGKYQTGNKLQLEYQRTEKQKRLEE